jgi:hypothetical protein
MTSIRRAAAKEKKNYVLIHGKLLHFHSRHDQIVPESFNQVLTFTDGLHLSYGLTNNDIL